MCKIKTYAVDVQFGDCDPAGIVFFPNFCRWMDAASLNFFLECGVPPWRELENSRSIIGTPLLEINVKFLKFCHIRAEASDPHGDRGVAHESVRANASRLPRRCPTVRGSRSAGLLHTRRIGAHSSHC